MKKIISICLITSMLFSMTAFAVEDEQITETEVIEEVITETEDELEEENEDVEDELEEENEDELEEENEDEEDALEEELPLSTQDLALLDLEGHWAEEYIKYLNEKEIILPTNSSFTPNTYIYRVEFMRYINRTFDFSDYVDVEFNDVPNTAWFYYDVAKAVYQGYIEGTGSGNMNPASNLTRQEAVVILSRLHNIEPSNTNSLNFTDADQIASWAAPYISNAVDLGYVSGRDTGAFDPLGYITRAEIAKILYYFGGNLLDSSWNYQENINPEQKNVTITKAETYLNDMVIEGNLFISQGVDGKVNLNNVEVLGEIIIASGNVTFTDVTCQTVTIKEPQNDLIKLDLKGDCNIIDMFVYSDASIKGNGIMNIIECNTYADGQLSLEGEFRDVALLNGVDTTITDSTISTMYFSQDAKDVEILLYNTNVETATLNNKCTLMGEDSYIYEMFINGNDARIVIDYKLYTLDENCSMILNGVYVQGGKINKVTTEEFYVNIGDVVGDIVTETTIEQKDIFAIMFKNKELELDEDYKFEDSILTIYSEVFEGLDENSYVKIILSDGSEIFISIYFSDMSQTTLVEYNYSFDKYVDEDLLVVTVSPALGKTIEDVVYGGYYYLKSNEYYVNDNKIYISPDYLKTISNGTASFEIKMSGLNNPKFIIEISNSIEPNNVEPSIFTFDRNIASEDYQDLVVTVNITQGEFEGVVNGEKELVSNIDYTYKDGILTIRREYIMNLDTRVTQELKVITSLGVSPTFEIEINETNQVVAIIVDVLGNPVSDVTVICKEITTTTDKNGKAYFNLVHGMKTIYFEKLGYKSDYATFYTKDDILEQTFTIELD